MSLFSFKEVKNDAEIITKDGFYVRLVKRRGKYHFKLSNEEITFRSVDPFRVKEDPISFAEINIVPANITHNGKNNYSLENENTLYFNYLRRKKKGWFKKHNRNSVNSLSISQERTVYVFIPNVQKPQEWVGKFIKNLQCFSFKVEVFDWSGSKEQIQQVKQYLQGQHNPPYKFILAIGRVAEALPIFANEQDGYLYGVRNLIDDLNPIESVSILNLFHVTKSPMTDKLHYIQLDTSKKVNLSKCLKEVPMK